MGLTSKAANSLTKSKISRTYGNATTNSSYHYSCCPYGNDKNEGRSTYWNILWWLLLLDWWQ